MLDLSQIHEFIEDGSTSERLVLQHLVKLSQFMCHCRVGAGLVHPGAQAAVKRPHGRVAA